MRTTYDIQRLQKAEDALTTIATSQTITELEYESLVQEEDDILEQLTDLQVALAEATTLKKQASLLRRISFLTQELEDYIRPHGDSLGKEIDYYVALSAHVSQYSDMDGKTGR